MYVCLLSKISSYLKYEHKVMFCNAYIQPHFNYCNVIWDNSSNYNLSRVTKLRKRAFKIILRNDLDFENAKIRLNIVVWTKCICKRANVKFKVANSLISKYVCDLF